MSYVYCTLQREATASASAVSKQITDLDRTGDGKKFSKMRISDLSAHRAEKTDQFLCPKTKKGRKKSIYFRRDLTFVIEI